MSLRKTSDQNAYAVSSSRLIPSCHSPTSTEKKFSVFYENPDVLCHAHEIPPAVHILRQINLFRARPIDFFSPYASIIAYHIFLGVIRQAIWCHKPLENKIIFTIARASISQIYGCRQIYGRETNSTTYITMHSHALCLEDEMGMECRLHGTGNKPIRRSRWKNWR
jgi:hypothetical protein